MSDAELNAIEETLPYHPQPDDTARLIAEIRTLRAALADAESGLAIAKARGACGCTDGFVCTICKATNNVYAALHRRAAEVMP